VLHPIDQGIPGDDEVEEIVARDLFVQTADITQQLVKEINC